MAVMLGATAGVQDTHATASSLSVSVADGANPSVNVAPTADGRFIASEKTTFSVSTTHAAGYKVTATSTALKDSTNTISALTLPSGASGIAEANYEDNDYASENNLNNTWGYLPSKICTTSGTTTTCNANTLYLPAPISGTQTLDEVNSATNNTYDINIGARVTTATAQGAYATTFTVAVVGNATPYTITYVDNSGAATGMPTPNPTSGTSDGETAANAVSATVPVRDGYEFKGWCSVSTSSESCSGTTYNSDGGGTNRNLTLSQTSATNSFNLYAMWNKMATLADITHMQDAFSCADTPDGTTNDLTDIRDGKTYTVAKINGACWMTQNLAIEPGVAMTADDTNIADAYTSSNPYTLPGTGYDLRIDGAASGTAVDGSASTGNCRSTTNRSNTNYAGPGWTNACTHVATDADASETGSSACGGSTCTKEQLGAWYNYAAATAGTIYGTSASPGTASTIGTYNICPKGWTLPADGASAGQISSVTSYASFFNPLYGGYYYNGSHSGATMNGAWWSATVYNARNRDALYYNSDGLRTNAITRCNGYYVRCVRSS